MEQAKGLTIIQCSVAIIVLAAIGLAGWLLSPGAHQTEMRAAPATTGAPNTLLYARVDGLSMTVNSMALSGAFHNRW